MYLKVNHKQIKGSALAFILLPKSFNLQNCLSLFLFAFFKEHVVKICFNISDSST